MIFLASKFYVLRDKCLVNTGLVQQITICPYGSLVSCSNNKLSAILFSYSEAVVMRDILEKLEKNGVGYDIVEFDVL